MSEQITFATSDFASNPEPRCPCILLLDVSGSMSGRPINELNAGLVTFRDELLADSLALKRVELGIVTFGPVHVEQPFTSAANFFPPILFAQGDTPMGAAITKALDMVEERKREYRANGISYYRPWIECRRDRVAAIPSPCLCTDHAVDGTVTSGGRKTGSGAG